MRDVASVYEETATSSFMPPRRVTLMLRLCSHVKVQDPKYLRPPQIVLGYGKRGREQITERRAHRQAQVFETDHSHTGKRLPCSPSSRVSDLASGSSCRSFGNLYEWLLLCAYLLFRVDAGRPQDAPAGGYNLMKLNLAEGCAQNQ